MKLDNWRRITHSTLLRLQEAVTFRRRWAATSPQESVFVNANSEMVSKLLHNAATNIYNEFNFPLASVLCLFVTHLFQVPLINYQSLVQLSAGVPEQAASKLRACDGEGRSFSNHRAPSWSPSLLHSTAKRPGRGSEVYWGGAAAPSLRGAAPLYITKEWNGDGLKIIIHLVFTIQPDNRTRPLVSLFFLSFFFLNRFCFRIR